jgi:hypothetical protein
MPRRREAIDVADLGDDQHHEVAADAADPAEHRDAVVVPGKLIDLGGERVDLAFEVGIRRNKTSSAIATELRRSGIPYRVAVKTDSGPSLPPTCPGTRQTGCSW